MKIYAAKQVGDLSYFVSDISILGQIIRTAQIRQSNNPEFNPRVKKKQYYVSLSRNMTAAAIRNNKRWRYGVVIDGDKLSNRYHIEPFSFAGTSINRGNQLGVKELTAYDDGTYKLRLVSWPAMDISKSTFEYLEDLILSKDETFNQEHKLVIQDGGKRRVGGRMITKKYVYNVKHGDGRKLLGKVEDLPNEIVEFLTTSSETNEYEERVWTNTQYIDISGCIKGLILPKGEIPDFETEQENKIIVDIRECLDEEYDEYKLTYYR